MTRRSKASTDRLLRLALSLAIENQKRRGNQWTLTAKEALVLEGATAMLGVSLVVFIDDCTEFSITDFSAEGDLALGPKLPDGGNYGASAQTTATNQ